MFEFIKKNLANNETTLEKPVEQVRAELYAEVEQEVEQKFRENFNLGCLFQEPEQPSLLSNFLPIVNFIVVIIILIKLFTLN